MLVNVMGLDFDSLANVDVSVSLRKSRIVANPCKEHLSLLVDLLDLPLFIRSFRNETRRRPRARESSTIVPPLADGLPIVAVDNHFNTCHSCLCVCVCVCVSVCVCACVCLCLCFCSWIRMDSR